MIMFDGIEVKRSLCELTWLYYEYGQDHDTLVENV